MPKGPSFWFDTRVYLGVAAALTIVIMFYNHYIAILGIIVLYALYMYGRERFLERQKVLSVYLREMTYHIGEGSGYAVENLPIAIAIVDESGKAHWFNTLLAEWSGGAIEPGDSILEVWPELSLKKIWGKAGNLVIQTSSRFLNIMHRPLEAGSVNSQMMILYITDITEIEMVKLEYKANQAVLAHIQIDNYDDVLKGLTESQRAAILSEVNKKLSEWIAELEGFLKKYSEGLYIAIINRQALDKVMTDKFEILDIIRTIHDGNKIPVTLSMGVAADEITIALLAQRAQAGLDLALGRGGDQAAVHVDGKMHFYGGKAKSVEKNTRVKARVVAHAIREIINDAENVIIMGHSAEDFDSLGAALGIAKMVSHLKKTANIVVSQSGAALEKLSDFLGDYEEYQDLFINEQEALNIASAKTLLFVVDTHRPELTAAPELLTKCEKVIVIDHHRRAEEFIANPLLIYLEPSASSASELVTELLIYFDDKLDLTRLEATALYAGIVVDTKNFAVQTGVRTFDATAYLRRSGADPALVRHLFRVDFDTIRNRAEIVRSAQILPGGVLIAVCPREVKNVQMVSAQAADSMLNIEGIRVSIVLFHADSGVIGVSARSQGDVNVQLIMEELGGGGHQTVAGAQVKNATLEEVKQKITEMISKYLGESDVS